MAATLNNLNTPVSVGEARDGLSDALRAFRTAGDAAEPIVFGSHRKPEGVILAYAQFLGLVEAARLLEDLGDISLLRERLSRTSDPSDLQDLDSVAHELSLDDAL